VIKPIWAKLSAKSPFRMGYIARISDCIMSLIMWEPLRAARIPKAGLALGGAMAWLLALEGGVSAGAAAA
jgi:hypothetical protein